MTPPDTLSVRSVQYQLAAPQTENYFRPPPRNLVTAGLQGPSRPLPYLDHMQSAFGPGHDLSTIQTFVGPTARAAGRGLGALAYTVGDRIVFAQEPTPELVAHETAHVIQQRWGDVPSSGQGPLSYMLEHEAQLVARDVVAGRPVSAPAATAPSAGRAPSQAPAQLAPDPRGQEADRAATEMWNTISGINELGAEVEFLYYTSAGAMTLVSFTRVTEGKGSTSTTTFDKFKEDTLGFAGGKAEGSGLVTKVGETQRYVSFRFRRDRRRWISAAFSGESPSQHPTTPSEGRATPNVATAGWSPDLNSGALEIAKAHMPLIWAYPGGSADYHLSVTYEDDRITRASPDLFETHGGTGPQFAPAEASFQSTLKQTVLAFSQGLGSRTILLKLQGEAPAGGKTSTWRVVSAAVERGATAPVPDEATAIIAEYRQTHDKIIAEWRAGVKDAAVYAAMLGAEQLAFWMIGGVLAKGAGAVIEAAAPRLIGFIRAGAKGGSRAGAELLETMIARLPTAEREQMQLLARKAETEGLKALTKAESKQMNQLLARMEHLLDQPLDAAEKSILRGRMGTRFLGSKASVDAAFQAAERGYQIHHRLPLEWAHHFPGFDVNGAKNLIALETEVHRGVNACWTRLRTGATGKVNKSAAERTASIIDNHFGSWYDKVPSTSGSTLAAEVDVAKQAALKQLDKLISTL